MTYFTEIEKNNPKNFMEVGKTVNCQSNSEQKRVMLTIPDFKLYCRTIVTKPAWNWHKKRHVNQ
jgi:hypothetical protein